MLLINTRALIENLLDFSRSRDQPVPRVFPLASWRAPTKKPGYVVGNYIELDIPDDINPDATLSVEPRTDYSKSSRGWPNTHNTEAVAGKIRIDNHTSQPQSIPRHDHVCQVLLTHFPDATVNSTPSINTGSLLLPPTSAAQANSSSVKLDSDTILPDTTRSKFQQLLQTYNAVLDPTISGYNGAIGTFEAVIMLGPVPPQQLKGRLPQHARNKFVGLQHKFDELEYQGIFQRPKQFILLWAI